MSENEPNRNCYGEALELLHRFPDAMLCHGYPKLQVADGLVPAGTLYGHAWIETKGFAIDAVTGVALPVDAFYGLGQIDDSQTQRFGLDQAVAMVEAEENAGPWGDVPKEAKFC